MSSDPKPEAQKAEAQKPAAQQPDAQKADAQKPDAKQQEAAKGAAGGAPVDPKANKPRVFLINGREFSVDRRYDPVAVLGEGAYGTVCLCNDYKAPKGTKVAMKKSFFTPAAWKGMALRTLREIYIMRFIKHPNLVRLTDIMPPLKRDAYDCIYTCMEAMDTDLRRIIRSSQKLENVDLQILMYQTIKGIRYMHRAGLVHRDIKPSNILVNADLSLKICDFGLSRGILEGEDEEEKKMTEYVVTRHYRAPEVMTNPSKYNEQIDVFSIGCVFAELLDTKLRDKLEKNTKHFRKRMEDAKFDLGGSKDHPIIPVMLGDARLATQFADEMLKEGIYVIDFSFPVVPKGQARIRVQVSAAHEIEHLDRAADAFIAVRKRLQGQ